MRSPGTIYFVSDDYLHCSKVFWQFGSWQMTSLLGWPFGLADVSHFWDFQPLPLDLFGAAYECFRCMSVL